MTKTVAYRWHVRKVMNEHGMQSTTDLVPLLAEKGIRTLRDAREAAEKSYYARIKY